MGSVSVARELLGHTTHDEGVWMLLAVVVPGLAMELGRGGVYDSPYAQDYYVRRFGFMFGGGQSGVYGLEAIQRSSDPMHQLHHALHHRPPHQEKAMVELAPLKMMTKERRPKQLQFAA